MEFLRLTSPDDFRVPDLYTAYCTSFPEDERRSKEQFKQLFGNSDAKIYSITEDSQPVGYLIAWTLTGFLFIEHLEVFPDFRSLGYGSRVLTELSKDHSKIVLESEPRHLDDTAEKRIQFYEKSGFLILKDDYVQPSYGEGKNPVSLWLLANWKPERTDWITENIYDVVYR